MVAGIFKLAYIFTFQNFCRRPVGQDVFLKHFWDCYKTFQQTSTEEAGMPAYFRFLTLLGEEQPLTLELSPNPLYHHQSAQTN
jgi:hypothetical protein